jgi:hypothetical protein
MRMPVFCGSEYELPLPQQHQIREFISPDYNTTRLLHMQEGPKLILATLFLRRNADKVSIYDEKTR